MKRWHYGLLFGILTVALAGYLISVNKTKAWGDCPPPTQDFTQPCETQDPPQPDPTDPNATIKTVTTGYSSNGANGVTYGDFVESFPSNAGQIYQIDAEITRNDLPSPGIEFWINNTGVRGDGPHYIVQGLDSSSNAQTFQSFSNYLNGGINSTDYTYYAFLVIRLSARQTAFNNNDVQVKWTMHRREFADLTETNLITPTIQVGQSPQFAWNTNGTDANPSIAPVRKMFMGGPNGISG